MRKIQSLAAVSIFSCLLVTASLALAQSIPSRYRATITYVSGSCSKEHIQLVDKGDVLLLKKAEGIVITVPGLPDMSGPLHNQVRFRVVADAPGEYGDGMRGKLTATGRFDASTVQMVLVAEYQKDRKAQCSQSWNISGKR